jgi:hypothetical protein
VQQVAAPEQELAAIGIVVAAAVAGPVINVLDQLVTGVAAVSIYALHNAVDIVLFTHA